MLREVAALFPFKPPRALGLLDSDVLQVAIAATLRAAP
jgi:hypothetical protein